VITVEHGSPPLLVVVLNLPYSRVGPLAARTIATMPACTAAGRSDHAATTTANSGSARASGIGFRVEKLAEWLGASDPIP
jgi:hypothetical protein